MKSLLTLETRVEKARMNSILHYDGMPLTADFVVAAVRAGLTAAAPRAVAAR